jgi:ParB-like chromosome segregation protein Spo0J
MLAITYRRLDDLRDDPRNARKHSSAQVRTIEELLAEYGWTTPMGMADGQLIYGHARRKAAMNLRARGVPIPGNDDADLGPTVDLSHLSADQRRAYALADNAVALKAGWHETILADELTALQAEAFDLSLTAFDTAEIESLIGAAHDASAITETPVSLVQDRFWISVRGPLASQADALQRLRAVMAEVPGLTVELGTVMDGE